MFGVPAVVAINSFPTDTTAEVEAIREVALEAGARRRGRRDPLHRRRPRRRRPGARGLGGRLARRPDFQLLYPDDAPLGEKILTIATKVYGAAGIELLPAAKKALKLYEDLGFGRAAGLHGEDPVLAEPRRGAEGPAVGVHRHRSATSGCRPGAGFITPLVGEMRTMPGLPSRPGGENIDIDADGNIVGLFCRAAAWRRGRPREPSGASCSSR